MSTRKFQKKTKKSGMASKSYVKKAIHKAADLGFIDLALDLTSTIFTHTPVHLTGIAEGDGDSNRDGQHINLNSLQMRLQAQPNTTTATAAHCRIIIFKWHRTSSPATNSILQLSGTLQAPISPYTKTTSKGQFQILYTRMFNVTLVGANQHVTFKLFRKLRGQTLFSGSSATNDTKGSIWVQIVSDLSTNGPDIHAHFRLFYEK